MTTPDTSAVRAWARDNGYDVADRGRLPVEITDAYRTAHGADAQAAKPAVKKPAVKKPAVKKAAPVKRSSKAAPAGSTVPAPAAQEASAPAEPLEQPAADVAAPQPKPSLVNDDRRLVALGEELAALTQRVAALEKAAGTRSNGGKGTGRFRRRA